MVRKIELTRSGTIILVVRVDLKKIELLEQSVRKLLLPLQMKLQNKNAIISLLTVTALYFFPIASLKLVIVFL